MKRAIKQTSILTLGNGFSRLLGIFILVVLTRIMDVSEFGHFRYLYNVASLFSLIVTGFPISLTKFIGENPTDRERNNIYLTNSITAITALYILLLIAFRIYYDNYILLDLLLLGILVDSLYIGLSRGLLNIMKLSMFRLLKNIIQLAAVGLTVLLSINIGTTEAVLYFSFSTMLSLMIFEIYKRDIKIKLLISRDILGRLVKYTIPVTLGAVGWSVLLTANPIIIERFRGLDSVAYYGAGISLVQIFALLPEAMISIILPKVAGAGYKKKVIKPFLLGVGGSIFISMVILAAIYLFRERIIILIFSKKYLNVASIIILLGIGQISLMTHQLFASFWQGMGKPAIPSITITIGCIVNLLGSVYLTRSYGIWGTSLAYAVGTSCSLVSISTYFFFKRNTMIDS